MACFNVGTGPVDSAHGKKMLREIAELSLNVGERDESGCAQARRPVALGQVLCLFEEGQRKAGRSSTLVNQAEAVKYPHQSLSVLTQSEEL